MTFTERKMLVVNEVKLPTAHVLLKDGQQLFPFVPIMRTLGYTVQRSGEAVFIEKDGARWRFLSTARRRSFNSGTERYTWSELNFQNGFPSTLVKRAKKYV